MSAEGVVCVLRMVGSRVLEGIVNATGIYMDLRIANNFLF